MSDRVRTVLAFLLIIVILLVWSLLNKPKEKPAPAETAKPDTVHVVKEPIEKRMPIIPEKADTIVVERRKFRVVLSSSGGSVKEFYLKEYNINIVPDGQYLFITQVNNQEIPNFAYQWDDDSVIFTYSNKGLDLRKAYYFNNPYGFQLSIDIPDTMQQILSLKSGVRVTEEKNRGEDLRHFNVYVKNKKVDKITKKIKDEFKYSDDLKWFALRSKYFMLVVNNLAKFDAVNFYKLPKEDKAKEANSQIANNKIYNAAFGCYYMRGGGNRYGAEILGSERIDVVVLLLPVKYSELIAFKKGYEEVASGGIWGPISRIILLIFNFIYSIFKNYGISIILFAIIIKVAFFPLSRKMIVSQHKMQMLQPELKKLQKKYKDNPQRLNAEMMQLYKTYKVNPFSGCLPLLIQMPIFFALYQTLITSIEFRQAHFMFWLTDLSVKDPYYVLPIAMGIMMLVQSLITTVDPRQKYMIIFMPIVMVFIFLNFPSGLQLYWFSYNILTLVEHIITKRGGIK